MTKPFQIASFALLAALLIACGPNAREKTITTTLTTVNAARVAFVVWDDKTQDQIIDHAASEETGQAQLDAHRKKRDELVQAFEAVYYAIAVAATDKEDQNVANMLSAAARLYQAYKTVIGRDPPQ
jgi:hypothetical protein